MPRSFGPIPLPLTSPRTSVRWWPVVWSIAIVALVVRLYLAFLWLRFGMAKVEAGWLSDNPVGALLTVVAAGQTRMPVPWLSVVAEWLLAVHADVVLSVLLPLTEIALAAAFLTGVYVRIAATAGVAINTSLILGGLASVAFDGRIIALQALLLLAGRRAGAIGLPAIVRLVRAARQEVSPVAEDGTGPEPRRRAA